MGSSSYFQTPLGAASGRQGSGSGEPDRGQGVGPGPETPPLRAERERVPPHYPAQRSVDEPGVSSKELGVELVQALRSMPEVLKESLQGFGRPEERPDDTAQATDKLNAIAGFKFEFS